MGLLFLVISMAEAGPRQLLDLVARPEVLVPALLGCLLLLTAYMACGRWDRVRLRGP